MQRLCFGFNRSDVMGFIPLLLLDIFLRRAGPGGVKTKAA